jgi:SAM-dependent methyltransferase
MTGKIIKRANISKNGGMTMLSTLLKQKLRKHPVIETLLSLVRVGKKRPDQDFYETYIEGKKGIEIGGPSTLFKVALPIYEKVGELDGVNFSNDTVWKGVSQPGRSLTYIGNKKGIQFISEATDLSQIKSNRYDFLLSSNCLEHIANPLKALLEWKRVIRSGGALILVLPNKVSNFDHKRPFTKFEHILDDLRNETNEYDLTHLDEILALHDLSMDPPAGTIEHFKNRSLDNFNNRTLHHHVFNIDLMKKMLTHIGFNVIETIETRTDFFALALKKD